MASRDVHLVVRIYPENGEDADAIAKEVRAVAAAAMFDALVGFGHVKTKDFRILSEDEVKNKYPDEPPPGVAVTDGVYLGKKL